MLNYEHRVLIFRLLKSHGLKRVGAMAATSESLLAQQMINLTGVSLSLLLPFPALGKKTLPRNYLFLRGLLSLVGEAEKCTACTATGHVAASPLVPPGRGTNEWNSLLTKEDKSFLFPADLPRSLAGTREDEENGRNFRDWKHSRHDGWSLKRIRELTKYPRLFRIYRSRVPQSLFLVSCRSLKRWTKTDTRRDCISTAGTLFISSVFRIVSVKSNAQIAEQRPIPFFKLLQGKMLERSISPLRVSTISSNLLLLFS